MTLPSRFVSLVLIYCFVVSVGPQVRATGPAAKTAATVETKSSLIETALDFLEKTFSPTQQTVDEEDVAVGQGGLRFRLSEAPEQAEKRAINKVAVATVLSAAETEKILNRLPAIAAEPTDEAAFALRERSLPPPRTGRTIEQAFPPPIPIAAPEEKNVGPLEVLRFSPEGDVPIAPNLSVTFSQPMVAVSSQEEAAQNVPVQITPEPKGHWRWIGTKTLLFEPDVLPAGCNSR